MKLQKEHYNSYLSIVDYKIVTMKVLKFMLVELGGLEKNDKKPLEYDRDACYI